MLLFNVEFFRIFFLTKTVRISECPDKKISTVLQRFIIQYFFKIRLNNQLCFNFFKKHHFTDSFHFLCDFNIMIHLKQFKCLYIYVIKYKLSFKKQIISLGHV